jgi:hypothetical protein
LLRHFGVVDNAVDVTDVSLRRSPIRRDVDIEMDVALSTSLSTFSYTVKSSESPE